MALAGQAAANPSDRALARSLFAITQHLAHDCAIRASHPPCPSERVPYSADRFVDRNIRIGFPIFLPKKFSVE
jgi:hypothetical protein